MLSVHSAQVHNVRDISQSRCRRVVVGCLYRCSAQCVLLLTAQCSVYRLSVSDHGCQCIFSAHCAMCVRYHSAQCVQDITLRNVCERYHSAQCVQDITVHNVCKISQCTMCVRYHSAQCGVQAVSDHGCLYREQGPEAPMCSLVQFGFERLL